MAKRIQVTDDLAISFDQRARGEETPYWVGRIWRKTGNKFADVGYFSNNGCGGCTIINPPAVEKELGELVKPFVPEREYAGEIADTVISYAEMLGYGLKCERERWTLADQCAMTWGEGNARVQAEQKNERIYMLKRATQLRPKGYSLVAIKEDGKTKYLVVRAMEQNEIIRIMAKQGVQDFEILKGL